MGDYSTYSFETPGTLYMTTLMGLFPMGVSLEPHDCHTEDGCGLESEPIKGVGIVWVSTNEVTAQDGCETPDMAVLHVYATEDEIEYYEVITAEGDGSSKYGKFNRAEAEAFIVEHS